MGVEKEVHLSLTGEGLSPVNRASVHREAVCRNRPESGLSFEEPQSKTGLFEGNKFHDRFAGFYDDDFLTIDGLFEKSGKMSLGFVNVHLVRMGIRTQIPRSRKNSSEFWNSLRLFPISVF